MSRVPAGRAVESGGVRHLTVADRLSIDQVAVNEGRLLVAMTEVHPYAGGDTAVLVEDFRLKLNTNVHAIRTGQSSDRHEVPRW